MCSLWSRRGRGGLQGLGPRAAPQLTSFLSTRQESGSHTPPALERPESAPRARLWRLRKGKTACGSPSWRLMACHSPGPGCDISTVLTYEGGRQGLYGPTFWITELRLRELKTAAPGQGQDSNSSPPGPGPSLSGRTRARGARCQGSPPPLQELGRHHCLRFMKTQQCSGSTPAELLSRPGPFPAP